MCVLVGDHFEGSLRSELRNQDGEYIKCFDGLDFESYELFEGALIELFKDRGTQEDGLQPGWRYSIIDCDGKARTVSKHTKYDRMKYHAEHVL